ncbi:hypothetical protein Trydic_g22227 [Trypoxylus dichotomus]
MMASGCVVKVYFFLYCSVFISTVTNVGCSLKVQTGSKGVGDVRQDWGYVDVRPGAHMFWWLYYTTATSVSHYTERPLIIWLQGGPGMPASGYGNFIEIGPYNLHMKPRKHTWIKNFNVLFIDNPIGTGFSYYSNNGTLLKSTEDIGRDLVRFLKGFLEKHKDFELVPLYIFGESYGGKMATEFAYQLEKEIRNGIMHANLKGIGLGDSYTSPIDYVLNYAPFALTIGLIDMKGYKAIDDLAQQTQKAIDKGLYNKAFDLEVKITNTLDELTGGIDIYNIVIKSNSSSFPKFMSYEKKCNKFMNSVVKERLNIPEEVTWAYTNKDIYNALDEDILRSVTDRIEYLLNNTNIKIIVYNGIFDFIVNTCGTRSWLDKLNWIGAPLWDDTPQEALEINMINEGYVTRAGNLIFYVVLRAGHSVPIDNVIAMEEILRLELLESNN